SCKRSSIVIKTVFNTNTKNPAPAGFLISKNLVDFGLGMWDNEDISALCVARGSALFLKKLSTVAREYL
ncbi:MAG TPA: hypothetical protein DDY21_04565, partial [Candidatus Moranbacteria bacterium]|nr:hypothetical protein [Candidatus Moranbacteria bacterium]